MRLQYGSGNPKPDLRRTLLSHELSHWAARVLYCDRKRRAKSCTYRGQHDKRFYKVLGEIHRVLGTRRHARMLEARAGYDPPYGWLNEDIVVDQQGHMRVVPYVDVLDFSCANCGRHMKRGVAVMLDGAVQRVGSECAKHFQRASPRHLIGVRAQGSPHDARLL